MLHAVDLHGVDGHKISVLVMIGHNGIVPALHIPQQKPPLGVLVDIPPVAGVLPVLRRELLRTQQGLLLRLLHHGAPAGGKAHQRPGDRQLPIAAGGKVV